MRVPAFESCPPTLAFSVTLGKLFKLSVLLLLSIKRRLKYICDPFNINIQLINMYKMLRIVPDS